MEALIENLRITTGSKVIGFFIPGRNSSVSSYASRALSTIGKYGQQRRDIMGDFRKEKVIHVAGAYKYDDYFIVSSGKDLNPEDDEMEVKEDMSRGAIARAFTDFAKSKKVNRVFVTKFAEAIA